jgi:hypothetical protein
LFDRVGVQLPDYVTDCGVGWRVTPLQSKKLPQTCEMTINETVDTPVRVGAGQHRQNGEQNNMRQAIPFTVGPSRVLDFGQEIRSVSD